MCELCHETGFVVSGQDADYCACAKGQRIREAHRRGKQKAEPKRERLPYRDNGEDYKGEW